LLLALSRLNRSLKKRVEDPTTTGPTERPIAPLAGASRRGFDRIGRPLTACCSRDQTDAGPNNTEYRVMSPASFTPEQDLHFVLCDFGRSGHAYVETDPTHADASTIVRNLLDGQYNRPVGVLALNVEEGWVRDVSQIIAAKVRDVAQHDERELTSGTRDFIEAHSDPADQQQVLPLWQ
jgi:hypothetical protein